MEENSKMIDYIKLMLTMTIKSMICLLKIKIPAFKKGRKQQSIYTKV